MWRLIDFDATPCKQAGKTTVEVVCLSVCLCLCVLILDTAKFNVSNTNNKTILKFLEKEYPFNEHFCVGICIVTCSNASVLALIRIVLVSFIGSAALLAHSQSKYSNND